ncbi:MAG: hypothetical protein HY238_14110, partial [Acidobacteria bacterium]|nr:hypothetical protein [Acidobacteriota bacterium]
MQIPPTPVHDAPLTGPGAWRRDDFSGPADWEYHLKPRTLDEIDAAVRRIGEQGKNISTITAADATRIRDELRVGRGFVVVKGLPLDRYSEEEACIIYCGIGALLGETMPQNVKGDRLYSVRDEG